jgi:hypothetical protein
VASSAASAEAKVQAEDAKAKTAANIAELTERLAAAKAGLLGKLDAVGPLREAAVAAEAARVAAEEAKRKAARNLEPVSIFISRKTQRLARSAMNTARGIFGAVLAAGALAAIATFQHRRAGITPHLERADIAIYL